MLDNKIKVGIINLGINNIQSISNAYKTIGCNVKIINNRQKLLNFNIVVLPGVGSFKSGMKKIKSLDLKKILKKFLKKDPKNLLIGICLGMQLLFKSSNEHGITKGMNLIAGKVEPFSKTKVKIIPHMNWNKTKINKRSKLKRFNNKNFYFVHSFYCNPDDKNNIIGVTEHEKFKFCSILKKNNIIGLQFHPEKVEATD